MTYFKTFFLFVLLLSTASSSVAQSLLSATLQNSFTTYQQNRLQEKVFVHTDRTVYLAGDICWFKFYNVDAFFHTPLSISKIIYVELLDKDNKPVLQAKIPQQDGQSDGSFVLPASMTSGNYKLRAYTNWMKNFDTDYFFEKTLTIINSRAIYEADTSRKKDNYTFQFFPEGGNLVEGIESKVAFHLKNQSNKGINCQGVLINEKNDTITAFKTSKFGMGSFLFTPKSDEKYKALITLADGQKLTEVLPIIYTRGFVLKLEEQANEMLKIKVKTSETTSPNVYLFAHTRGIVKSVSSAALQNGEAVFLVDKTKLGDGISHFTVFNNAKQPVCERLYFKHPEHFLQINTTTDAPSYGFRQKINLSTTTSDQNNQAIAADMSMAVYEIDSLQGLDEMDISNYLWLTSDLVGNIESPAYYFANKNQETIEITDNLMLTHGWRRFKWEDILENTKPAFRFLPEYVGHLVTATVKNSNTGLNAANTEGYLSVPSAKKQLHAATSDANGRLKFDVKDFYHDGRLILQAHGAADSAYNVKIDNPFCEKYSSPLPDFSLLRFNAKALQQQNAKMQVQNAYFGQKIRQSTEPTLDTTPFYRQPDVRYLLDDYVRFLTIEEVLREYVVPVNVRKNDNKFHLHVWDEYLKKFFDDTPLVLLDGTPMFDINKLMSYEPLKIKRLDIMSRQYFLNNKAYNGVLNFSTYTNQLPDFEFDPHTAVLDYEGLQKQRIFYAPEYATPQQMSSKLPDFRHLLHWSPKVQTTEKGKTETHFYSSDVAGKYVVVLQGMTKDGKTGSQVVLFEVK
jgi:hypothetical protein